MCLFFVHLVRPVCNRGVCLCVCVFPTAAILLRIAASRTAKASGTENTSPVRAAMCTPYVTPLAT